MKKMKLIGLSICMASILVAGAANAVTYSNGYGWTKEGKKAITELNKQGYHDVEVLYTQTLRCRSGTQQQTDCLLGISLRLRLFTRAWSGNVERDDMMVVEKLFDQLRRLCR